MDLMDLMNNFLLERSRTMDRTPSYNTRLDSHHRLFGNRKPEEVERELYLKKIYNLNLLGNHHH